VAPPWSVAPGGLVVIVRLTPKGGRDAIDGVQALADGTTVLKARVRAAASEGAANAALIRLIADALHVAPGRVTLVAGASSRLKRLRVEGDGAALAAQLERLVA
jgi:uncharacterized protein